MVLCAVVRVSTHPHLSLAFNRAAAHTHLKDYKKAIADCESSLRIDANYSKAYSRLGTALFYEGSYQKAVEKYAKAVELDPTNEGCHLSRWRVT